MAFGVCEENVKWFRSYLSNRTQTVKYKNFRSRNINVKSGVPQGSHLGPILFIIFINDIISELKFTKAQLFADDLKLYAIVSSLMDCILFNKDLETLDRWCETNGMEMNAKKCNVISFYRKNCCNYEYKLSTNDIEPLERVSCIRDLGIMMDSKLKFREHVNIIINKANKQLGFVMRNSKNFQSKETLRILYMSLVRPILTYNSVVWYPQNKETFDRLDKIQHKFLRFASFQLGIRRNLHDYTIIANHLKIPTIKSVFDVNDLSFIYRLCNNFTKCNELTNHINKPSNQHNIRYPNIFDLPYLLRDYLQNSPVYRPQKLANTHVRNQPFHGLLPKTFNCKAKRVI